MLEKKRNRAVVYLLGLLYVLFAIILSACSSSGGEDPVPVLTAIELAPAEIDIYLNSEQEFTVIGKDQNGEIMSIEADWTISGDIGTISPEKGETTVFTATAIGEGEIRAAVGTISGTALIKVSEEPQDPSVLTEIEINPASATVVEGDTVDFELSAKDQYGEDFDLSGMEVEWSVEGDIGIVLPVNDLSTTFTASYPGQGKVKAVVNSREAEAEIIVVEAEDPPVLDRIEITPTEATISEGESVEIEAIGYDQYDNEYTINPVWSVSGISGIFNPEIGAETTFIPNEAGNGIITAAVDSISAEANITVNEVPRLARIEITQDGIAPIEPVTVYEGDELSFSAKAYDQYNNLMSVNLNWAVIGDIGSVLSPGYSTIFTAENPGSGSIVASYDGIEDTVEILVKPTTLYVGVDKDYSTIQEAVDAATDEKVITIIVDEGTYNECVVINSKDIILKSSNSEDPLVVENTIINGGENSSVIQVRGSELNTVIVEGFTITGGMGSDLIGSSFYGGGVYVHTVFTTLRNNIIYANEAHHGGGGIYGYMCDMVLEGNTIESNSSYLEGGGIKLSAGVGYTLQVDMIDNIIRNNSSSDRNGGGIYTWNVAGTWSNNIIEGNSAETYAGGIFLSESYPHIINNEIKNNTAEAGVGGIYVTNDTEGSLIIENNNISGNENKDSLNGYAGGLSIGSTGVEIKDNIISNNTAAHGGGIYVLEDTILTNNTLEYNTADFGGGIFVKDGITISGTGNEFVGNEGYAIYLDNLAIWSDLGDNTFSGNNPGPIYPEP